MGRRIADNNVSEKHSGDVVQIWSIADAPEAFRLVAPQDAEWIAWIPSDLACSGIEALLAASPDVIRHLLPDGGVLLTGRNAASMLASTDLHGRAHLSE